MKKLILVAGAIAGFAAQASTIGYWPMTKTASGEYIDDVSAGGHRLTLQPASQGSWDFHTTDLGWTDNLPPNPDAIGAASACPNYVTTRPRTDGSTTYLPVIKGTGSTYANLCEALAVDEDFTIETWYRPTTLPATGGKNQIFLYNTLGVRGGYAWSIFSTSTEGNYTIKLLVCTNTVPYSTTYISLGATLYSSELLNRWNHYALVHIAGTSAKSGSWKFYLNGRLRGSTSDTLGITDVSFGSSSMVFISGCQSSNAQQLIGDVAVVRVSDAALSAADFLCAATSDETVAYWPMSLIVNASSSFAVPSSVGVNCDLSRRSTACGGLEIVASDTGWTQPTNPDPLAYNAGPWLSDTMAQIDYGVTNASGKYAAVFTCSSAEVGSALISTNDFCFEGWYKATALPKTSGNNHVLLYANYNSVGGWIFNIYGTNTSGQCAFKVGQQGGSWFELGTVPATEILNKWAHYALTYKNEEGIWRFYFNGDLVGSNRGNRFASLKLSPFLQFFGCGSGTAQTPPGYVTTWRVSRSVDPERFLCGNNVVDRSLTWTGAGNTTWSAAEAALNWKDKDGTPVAWSNSRCAVFDGKGANDIVIGGLVAPSEIIVDSDTDITMYSQRYCAIGSCLAFYKRGSGTLWLKPQAAGKERGNINQSNNHISIEEGTLRVSHANGHYGLGYPDSSWGYEVSIHDGATLWIDERNSVGWEPINRACNTVFTIYEGGTLDLTTCAEKASENFNIQQFGTLILKGGAIVMPAEGHGSGCMNIRHRAVFAKNSTKTPYYFSRDKVKTPDTMSWKFCTNTVFEVEDVTDDAQPDVIFDCHLMGVYDWDTNTNTKGCSFCKTGAGKMVLQQENGNYAAGSITYPSGTSQVQAGELEIDAYYPAAFAVASGAYLSGTGTVSSVTLTSGAGLRGTFANRKGMTVTGDCTIGATGKVELTGAPAKLRSVTLLRVGGTITGEANFANWTLTVDGAATSELTLRVLNQRLVAHTDQGLVFIVK